MQSKSTPFLLTLLFPLVVVGGVLMTACEVQAKEAERKAAHKSSTLFAAGAPIFIRAKDLPAAFNRKGVEVTVLDTRASKAFNKGHLPKAQRIEWEDTRAGIFERGSLIGGKLPRDLEALVEMFVDHGVSLHRPVLVCGAPTSGWGEEGRIAWTLQYLGHAQVFVLDGGCTASSLSVEKAKVDVKGKKWTPKVKRKLRAYKSDVAAATNRHSGAKNHAEKRSPQVLDVRTAEEFGGATPYFEARGGHIVGASHLHYKSLLNDDGTLLSAEKIRKKLREVGIDPERPVITYCTGGVRSAWAALALSRANVAAANYDGSIWEWAADDKLPMSKRPSAASQR